MKLVGVQDGVGIKEIHWDLDGEVPITNFELVPIGDTHIGAAEFDQAALQKTIDYVLAGEHRYVALMGDLINNTIPSSVGNVIEETMSMHDQLDLAVKLFSPLKDRVLVIVDGNHEARTKRVAGIDLTKLMAVQMDLGHLYSPGTGMVMLDLKFGKGTRSGVKTASHHFTVALAHGARSGTTNASAANGLEGLQKVIVNADLYIVGHTHKIVNFINEIFFVNTTGYIDTKLQYFVNSTAYLKYGGYGKDKLYKSIPIMPQTIKIRASEVRRLKIGNTSRTKQNFIADVINI